MQGKNGSSKHSPFLVPIALAFAQPITCNDPMAPLVVNNDVKPKPLSCIDVTIMVWSLPYCTLKGKVINPTLSQVQYVIGSTKQNPYETPHPF